MSQETVSEVAEINYRRRPRQRYSTEFKRGAVEQTLLPGASVSAIALSLDLNTNVLWRWRRQYEAGQLGSCEGQFLPVDLTCQAEAHSLEPKTSATFGDRIEVLIGKASVIVKGRPDAIALRRVFEALQ